MVHHLAANLAAPTVLVVFGGVVAIFRAAPDRSTPSALTERLHADGRAGRGHATGNAA